DIAQVVQEELGLRKGKRAPHAEAALATYVQAEWERAQRVLSHLPDDMPALWQALRRARRIYVIGQGASAALAHLLAYALRSQGLRAENPPADALSLQMILAEVTAHCAAVAVALGPESGDVAHFLQRAREQGAWSLAFVASPISPCALAAEEVLLCGEEGKPSFGAAALLMEAMVQGVHRESTPWGAIETNPSGSLGEELP
ncbi:MAG: SIS domain-containing protein, partial [Chloroflexi bacterium]|nr:SIS domain-containing protein [Chloroflexota bacterium]